VISPSSRMLDELDPLLRANWRHGNQSRARLSLAKDLGGAVGGGRNIWFFSTWSRTATRPSN